MVERATEPAIKDTMMNALVPHRADGIGFGEMERLAEAVAKSGMFGMKTKEQALALMAIAHAEGRHPALAAQDYDIIHGTPAKKAVAMLRDFFASGGKVQWHALTDDVADATFAHPIGGSVRISWDMERARQAGVLKNDNYKKFPRQMLRSRVVSEGVRTIFPAATSGMYVPEEAVEIEAIAEPQAAESVNFRNTSTLAATSRREVPYEPAVKPDPPPPDPLKEPDQAQWIKNLDAVLAQAGSKDEVAEIAGHSWVVAAIGKSSPFPKASKTRIQDMVTDAYAKFADAPVENWGDVDDGSSAAEPEPPVHPMVAEIRTMSMKQLNDLGTNAAHKQALKELDEATYQEVAATISGRLAELRAGG